MSDELNDEDPFAEGEKPDEENNITEGMVKKATYLIHKLAERKGQDFKEIQKKCRKLFGYENLAKVSREDGHKIIDKLIELTGGEEEKPGVPQGPTKPDEGTKHKIEGAVKDVDVPVTGDDKVTFVMRNSVRAAVDITLKEVVAKDVPVQGLGGFVFEISKVIFEAKMSEEASE